MAGKVLPWEAITARCQLTDSFRGKSGCLDPQALLRQIVSSHSFQTSYRLLPSIRENGLFLFLLWQVIEYNWTTSLYNRMFNFTFPTLQCYRMMKKNGNRTMDSMSCLRSICNITMRLFYQKHQIETLDVSSDNILINT